jgi:hypothetical protein
MKRRDFLAGLASILAFPSAAKAFVRPNEPSNPLLMPYKGKQLHDAGMFYCPYVPKNMHVSPYYDDFDPNKKFSRVHFQPSKSIQVREL